MGLENFKNQQEKKAVNIVAEFLEELTFLLRKFHKSGIFRRDIVEQSDEDHYTETLIKYLENEKPNSKFSFRYQVSQPKKRKVDIGVWLKKDRNHYIITMEAKFLPTKDYVTGEYAAIKRFKKCEHGHSNFDLEKGWLLPENVIIAYVKGCDLAKENIEQFERHYKSINKKIEKLCRTNEEDNCGLLWQISEQLQKNYFTTIARLTSEHTRTNNTKVILHHFWLPIAKKANQKNKKRK